MSIEYMKYSMLTVFILYLLYYIYVLHNTYYIILYYTILCCVMLYYIQYIYIYIDSMTYNMYGASLVLVWSYAKVPKVLQVGAEGRALALSHSHSLASLQL